VFHSQYIQFHTLLMTFKKNRKGTLTGFICAVASAMSFGLIPLFALPVMHSGMDFISVLIYRFGISCICLLPILIISHKSLKISFREIWQTALLAILYCCSATFLFWSYRYMSSGKATTLHFMYPVFTSLLMTLFLHEHFSWRTFFSIIIAVTGVAFIADEHTTNSDIPLTGLIIVLSSGLYYAIYLVIINQMKARNMGSLKLTFYVMLFGLIILILIAEVFGNGVAKVTTSTDGIHLILLALIPTVLSNLLLIHAIKRIGSTHTSVIGAFEPLTAVCVGILCFGEGLTLTAIIGIVCILTAVCILIYSKAANSSQLQNAQHTSR
jgi:drug/metabolite transporter (DMT)-like permease